jgi:hypothetical protein
MHDRTFARLTLGLFAVLATAACGSEEATPADSIGTTVGETDAPTTENPSTTLPGDGTADTTSAEPTTTDDPTVDPSTTTGGEECLGEDGCWGCTPTTPTQVLNGCTDASCEPFSNTRRLPLLEPDGSLPPLP